ncbi:hypothetical protein D9611_011497 [Ephemerocybe angulata]|uniref:Uncharacterized protein n=1 Tax=Ephemerocybe angulata TaxID=980116 RepID=A0A8H5CDB5_9AGAR|nr:hypothetical protein D9611_011497 [Tulosesus angulatus]
MFGGNDSQDRTDDSTGEHESFERGRNLAHGSSTNPIDIDNTRPADLEQLGSSGRNDSGRLAYGSSNEPQSGGQRASGNNADPYASSKAFSGDRAGHGYSQDSPERQPRIGRHGPSDTSQGTDSADSYGSANTNRGSNNNTESYGSSTQDSSNDNGDAFSPHGNRDTRGESNFDDPSHSTNNSLANKDSANNDSSSYGNASSNSNPEGDNSRSSSDKQGSWDQKVIQSGASTVGYNLDDTMAREIGESMKKLL